MGIPTHFEFTDDCPPEAVPTGAGDWEAVSMPAVPRVGEFVCFDQSQPQQACEFQVRRVSWEVSANTKDDPFEAYEGVTVLLGPTPV